jgi:pimeloyl-ACP methyl ester carboxylesterase
VDQGPRPLTAAPSKKQMLGEVRAIPELCRFAAKDRTAGLQIGDGHPVIVFPGFLANDALTAPLRRRLGELGYWNAGWRFGSNLGLKPGLMTQMVHYVRSVRAGQKRAVSLIGWSLGGLYAREVAKRIPDQVRLVVTLGTPATGDLHANNAWRLYERLNNHKVTSPPIDTDLSELPPVPVTSILTPADGIVAPECCDIGSGPIWETLRVGGTHIGLVWNAEVLKIIADRLAQPEGGWLPYRLR